MKKIIILYLVIAPNLLRAMQPTNRQQLKAQVIGLFARLQKDPHFLAQFLATADEAPDFKQVIPKILAMSPEEREAFFARFAVE